MAQLPRTAVTLVTGCAEAERLYAPYDRLHHPDPDTHAHADADSRAFDCDPVGDYGSGVRKVWAMLGDAGVRDLTCQIFEGGRHELHNETNRDEVFDYVLTWIEDHIS